MVVTWPVQAAAALFIFRNYAEIAGISATFPPGDFLPGFTGNYHFFLSQPSAAAGSGADPDGPRSEAA